MKANVSRRAARRDNWTSHQIRFGWGTDVANRDAYYYEQKVQSSHTNVTAVPVTMFAFGYWKKEIGHGQN